jgi:predicted DNA-binding antitoxin AbrB/MazE fold protein
MVASIRAVYERGHLRLLDPIELKEGQQVQITIVAPITNDEIDTRLRMAGLLAEIEAPDNAEELTPEERLRIGRLFLGQQPSEALIDEDRGQY